VLVVLVVVVVVVVVVVPKAAVSMDQACSSAPSAETIHLLQ